MTNFQYNIGINQKAAIDGNLDIDIIDIAIMDFLWNFQASNKIKKIDGGWFWAANTEIMKQLPIIGIKTTRGISKRIDKLINSGLLERNVDNRQLRQSFYRITEKYERVFRFTTRNESSKHIEREFQVTRNESSDYYNTIDNNTNNNINPNQANIEEIVEYLNELAEKNFRLSKATTEPINARLGEKYTVDDFKKVIDIKCSEWKGDAKMDSFLRPSTLFTPKNFENYVNQKKIAPSDADLIREYRASPGDFGRKYGINERIRIEDGLNGE